MEVGSSRKVKDMGNMLINGHCRIHSRSGIFSYHAQLIRHGSESHSNGPRTIISRLQVANNGLNAG